VTEEAARPLAPEAIVTLRDPAGRLTRWFCTPERLEDLAVGWLVGEGRARGPDDVGPIEIEPDASAVRLVAPAADLRRRPPPPPAGAARSPGLAERLTGDADLLRALFTEMFEHGVLRERSGGMHTGALVVDGRLRAVREDVSRHCVVDKLVGHAARAGEPLEAAAVLLSGRISGAIAVKAARAGAAALATMSIPTTLAAEIAGRSGVTLIGRARSAAPHVYPPVRS